MYPAFPPVDIHTAYVLYIPLLCTISLVLLYKNRASCYFFKPPFLSTPYNPISLISVSKTLLSLKLPTPTVTKFPVYLPL